MKKIVTAALLAATVLPGAASAQSRAELRRDRHDIREEQRELRDARDSGNPRAIHEQRRDVREARQEYREDLRDRDRAWSTDDWRRYREHNRGLYSRGRWNAPFRYNAFRAGVRIAPSYFGPRYILNDPWRYHLPRPGRFQVWVRHYGDLLLVDRRRGVVLRVIRNFYW